MKFFRQKAKKVCIIYGNCIVAIITELLKRKSEFEETFEIIYVRSFKNPSSKMVELPRDKIKKCSLFLLQRGHLQFPEFYSQLPSSCQVISFPLLSLKSLWPMNRNDPRNKPEPEKGFPFGRYPSGDRLVIKLLNKGLTASQIFERYSSTDIREFIDFAKIQKKELMSWKELDEKCDLPLNWYVAENFTKERLFWTPRHPTLKLMQMQTDSILKALGMSCLSQGAISMLHKNDPLGRLHLPIHPDVIRYFNLKWVDKNTKYKFYEEGWLTFEEYLKKYIEFK